jgi:ABC-type antimicrobial peptide transport system permease subunit
VRLEKRREIGIRRALGADRASVLRMVLSQGLGLTLAGVAGGPAVAFAMNGVLASLLFGVQPPDGDAPARRLDRHGRADCVLSAGAIGEANGSDDRVSRRIATNSRAAERVQRDENVARSRSMLCSDREGTPCADPSHPPLRNV